MLQASARTDAAIQEDVLRELGCDTHVAATDVGVAVAAGLVTLTGTVSSYVKELAAQEAAHRVRGVQGVVTHITVTIPGISGRTDADIAQAVRQTLQGERVAGHIQVTVREGIVTLSGRVRTWADKQTTLGAAGPARGVRHLDDKLHITPWLD